MSSPADLLAHPEVVAVSTRILRRFRVKEQDLNDGVADVQRRILPSLRNKPVFLWPKELAEWKRLAVRGTKHELIDRARKAKRRKGLGDEGLVAPEPDTSAAEGRRHTERHPLDHAKAMELIDQLLKEDPNGAAWAQILDGLCDDMDQAEIARQMGLPHQKVRDLTRTMRARFQQKVALVLGSCALAGAIVLWPRDQNVGAPPDLPTPAQQVAELRARGHAKALEKDWTGCVDAYVEARVIDPGDPPRGAVEEENRCRSEMGKADAPSSPTNP